jgi:hypothetical protein
MTPGRGKPHSAAIRSPYRQRVGADLLDDAVLPVPIACAGIRARESNPLAGRYLEVFHYADGPAFPAQPPWRHCAVCAVRQSNNHRV